MTLGPSRIYHRDFSEEDACQPKADGPKRSWMEAIVKNPDPTSPIDSLVPSLRVLTRACGLEMGESEGESQDRYVSFDVPSRKGEKRPTAHAPCPMPHAHMLGDLEEVLHNLVWEVETQKECHVGASQHQLKKFGSSSSKSNRRGERMMQVHCNLEQSLQMVALS